MGMAEGFWTSDFTESERHGVNMGYLLRQSG
jgi:hypothetical protein